VNTGRISGSALISEVKHALAAAEENIKYIFRLFGIFFFLWRYSPNLGLGLPS
jgi:hypothetical protein